MWSKINTQMGDCDAVSVIGRLDAAESVAQPTPRCLTASPGDFFVFGYFSGTDVGRVWGSITS